MKEEQKLNEQQKPKLDIFDVICRLFVEYKKSVAVLLDGCTWYRFFIVSGTFIILTLFAWINVKLNDI